VFNVFMSGVFTYGKDVSYSQLPWIYDRFISLTTSFYILYRHFKSHALRSLFYIPYSSKFSKKLPSKVKKLFWQPF